MCGIVGFAGHHQAAPILLDGLSKLEYRGYDSAGLAVRNGDEPAEVVKAVGRLKNLMEKTDDGKALPGCFGIGHTRWATHGEPNDTNAHPHINESGSIAVVHNGIIENFAKLRSWLQSQGIVFRSQTDTEVVAHLTNYFYEQTFDIFQAVKLALEKLEGSYALAVICKNFPDRIVVARKDCPLVVGLGEGENFLASDVPALIEHTREVVFLEQKELAVLYSDHVDLFNADGGKIIREPYHVDWDVGAAEKDGYAHFMLKEIHEQPKALTDTLRPRLVRNESGKPIDIAFDEVDFGQSWTSARRVVITACGTAYHAGVVAKYAFEHFARIPVVVDVASEFRYRNPILNKDDIFIVISQSGETADTLAALREAKARGFQVLGIVNVVGSSIAREADSVIYTWAGPEIAVATTKAYSAQLVVLYMLAMKLAKVRGKIDEKQFRKLLDDLRCIPDQIELLLGQKEKIQHFANRYVGARDIFFMGRGIDYAISLEGSLKLKEISYIHSEAYAAGELKHGTISLIEDGTLVVALATQPDLFQKTISNMVEVKARGAFVMAVTLEGNKAIEKAADYVVYIPEINPCFVNSLAIIPLQLFAYYIAVGRGCDVDKPRNLAKSVTVE